jgi:hypothetical protein
MLGIYARSMGSNVHVPTEPLMAMTMYHQMSGGQVDPHGGQVETALSSMARLISMIIYHRRRVVYSVFEAMRVVRLANMSHRRDGGGIKRTGDTRYFDMYIPNLLLVIFDVFQGYTRF